MDKYRAKTFNVDLEEGEFFDSYYYCSLLVQMGDVLVMRMAYPHEVGDGDSYMTIIGRHRYWSDYHFIAPGFSSFVGITCTFNDGNDN